MTAVSPHRPLRVLCLDIEGGYGGSSRSLFYAVSHLDRATVEPLIWCRKDGPIQPRYQAAGVAVAVKTAMPSASALPRFSRNVIHFARFARQWRAAAAFRAELLAMVKDQQIDVVHFNHEGLFWLACWLRSAWGGRQTMHIRTMVHNTVFGRWQHRTIAKSVDACAFITEGEQRNVAMLAGAPVNGAVIYNPAPPTPAIPPLPYPQIVPQEGVCTVACLANFSFMRGIDRLLEVAEVLRSRNERRIRFAVAGTMTLTGALPPALAAAAQKGQSLADVASEQGLADWFVFLGHVSEPERVLVAADLLFRPSREDNAWGRDVIEALGVGVPVVTLGTCQTFVESGETGVLLPDYAPESVADALVSLVENPAERARLADNARKRVSALCDPQQSAARLAALWRGETAQ